MWHSRLDHMFVSLDLLNFKLTLVALFAELQHLFFFHFKGACEEFLKNRRFSVSLFLRIKAPPSVLLSSHPPQTHVQTLSAELFLLRGQKWLLLHAWKSNMTEAFIVLNYKFIEKIQIV